MVAGSVRSASACGSPIPARPPRRAAAPRAGRHRAPGRARRRAPLRPWRNARSRADRGRARRRGVPQPRRPAARCARGSRRSANAPRARARTGAAPVGGLQPGRLGPDARRRAAPGAARRASPAPPTIWARGPPQSGQRHPPATLPRRAPLRSRRHRATDVRRLERRDRDLHLGHPERRYEVCDERSTTRLVVRRIPPRHEQHMQRPGLPHGKSVCDRAFTDSGAATPGLLPSRTAKWPEALDRRARWPHRAGSRGARDGVWSPSETAEIRSSSRSREGPAWRRVVRHSFGRG